MVTKGEAKVKNRIIEIKFSKCLYRRFQVTKMWSHGGPRQSQRGEIL